MALPGHQKGLGPPQQEGEAQAVSPGAQTEHEGTALPDELEVALALLAPLEPLDDAAVDPVPEPLEEAALTELPLRPVLETEWPLRLHAVPAINAGSRNSR